MPPKKFATEKPICLFVYRLYCCFPDYKANRWSEPAKSISPHSLSLSLSPLTAQWKIEVNSPEKANDRFMYIVFENCIVNGLGPFDNSIHIQERKHGSERKWIISSWFGKLCRVNRMCGDVWENVEDKAIIIDHVVCVCVCGLSLSHFCFIVLIERQFQLTSEVIKRKNAIIVCTSSRWDSVQSRVNI